MLDTPAGARNVLMSIYSARRMRSMAQNSRDKAPVQRVWRSCRAWHAPGAVLLVGIVTTLAAIWLVREQGRAEDQSNFERQSDAIWDTFRNRLRQQQGLMVAVRDFVARNRDAAPEEFAELWQTRIEQNRLLGTYPGFYEAGYAALPRDFVGDRAALEAGAAAGERAALRVEQRWLRHEGHVAGGADLWADSRQADAIFRAWRTGLPQATGRIELPSYEGERRDGFRLFLPVYDDLAANPQRRPRGVLFASFLIERMILSQFGVQGRSIEFHVYAGDRVAPESLLTENLIYPGSESARTIAAEASDPIRYRKTEEIFGTRWTVEFRSTVLFNNAVSPAALLWLGALGGLFSGLAAVMVHLEVARRMATQAEGAARAENAERARSEAGAKEQSLRALHARARKICREIEARLGAVPAAGRMNGALLQSTAGAVARVHETTLKLGPANEPGVPFRAAVEAWFAALQDEQPATFSLEEAETIADDLDPSARAQLLGAVAEAVGNALQHGAARRVSLHLRVERGRAVLRVHDDGTGFDPAAARVSGRGLERLHEAARELGGDFLIESRPGGPTSLRLRFALPAPGRRNIFAGQEAGA